MAAVFTRAKAYPAANMTITDLTADGSYPANGYPVTARDLGLRSIDSVQAYERTVQGNVAQFDVTNSKLKIFQTGAALSGLLSEAIAGDLSTANVFRLVAHGPVIV